MKILYLAKAIESGKFMNKIINTYSFIIFSKEKQYHQEIVKCDNKFLNNEII